MAKTMAVSYLTPGDVLTDVVMSVEGKVLLGKGVVLTAKHISLLNMWDIKQVFIESEEEAAMMSSEPVQQPAAIHISPGYVKFVQEYHSIITSISKSFSFIQKMKVVPVTSLKDNAGSIQASIEGHGLEAMSYLFASNPKLSEYICQHSVMVAYVAGMIACQMKWSKEDVIGVALAGLMHDIGNLAVNKTNDAGAVYLAETARLLKETKGLSSAVVLGIIQHRECIDGSGFPTGANTQKIHPYAKVIAVAEFFHREYTRQCFNPLSAMKMVSEEMFGKLDPEICQILVSRVRDGLMNSKVVISNGREAEIIYFHPNTYGLPVVRTLEGEIIDLSRRTDLGISRMIIEQEPSMML